MPYFNSFDSFNRRTIYFIPRDKKIEFVQGHMVDGKFKTKVFSNYLYDYKFVQEEFYIQQLASFFSSGRPLE